MNKDAEINELGMKITVLEAVIKQHTDDDKDGDNNEKKKEVEESSKFIKDIVLGDDTIINELNVNAHSVYNYCSDQSEPVYEDSQSDHAFISISSSNNDDNTSSFTRLLNDPVDDDYEPKNSTLDDVIDSKIRLSDCLIESSEESDDNILERNLEYDNRLEILEVKGQDDAVMDVKELSADTVEIEEDDNILDITMLSDDQIDVIGGDGKVDRYLPDDDDVIDDVLDDVR